MASSNSPGWVPVLVGSFVLASDRIENAGAW
jgi:hypothetical protein